jgi:curved DNA-binding protein CbpA
MPMINEYYFKILNVKPESSLDEIRSSYRKLAKANHPDLFPKEERHSQELKMMNINQAYMSILSYFNDGYGPGEREYSSYHTDENEREEEEETRSTEVGHLKDPSYTYYKLGFNYYSTALEMFNSRFKLRRDGGAKRAVSNEKLLELAILSIKYFQKSYEYFLTVVNEYPDSIWASDSEFRLNKLSNFNILYQKICDNIASDIKRIEKIKSRMK